MKHYYLLIALLSAYLFSSAQSSSNKTAYSLKEAVDYAVLHNATVKLRSLDAKIASQQKGEQGAKAFPQINGNVDFLHYQSIQKNVSENRVGSVVYNPTLPLGVPLAFAFALQNQLLPSVSGSQVLFDQSFFAGLKASKVYQELAEKNIDMSRIDVALAVTKAYYAVLVNERQLAYINVNVARVDSIYLQTKAQYNNGLSRSLDVDRSEVTYNNLIEERLRVSRLLDLSKSLLKFQMNLPINDSIHLTDDLNENLLSELLQIPDTHKVAYSSRIEYSILETQAKFNHIDTRSTQGGFYPRLSAIGTYGYTSGATQLSDLSNSSRYFNYSYLGLRLQVPIFNGFANHYRVQQKKLQEEKTAVNKKQLEQQIDLEVDQSLINLNNSLVSLKTQKRNLSLAEQTLNVLKAEHAEGISTSLDVTVAEADFKSAQTNYYNALYNALVSKADYEKATGTLLK